MKIKKHPSVYFISGCKAGTTFEYRVLQKQEQLALYGIQSVAQQDLAYSEETLREALSHDLLYLYRVAYNPFIEELIRQARARHIPVIFGTDDLVFEPELVHWVDPLKAMSYDRAALYYQGVWRYRQTLLACDYTVTSTEYLADLIRAHGKEVFVHRNGLSQWMIDAAVDLAQQRQARPEHDTIVVGYGSGTDTHRKDLAEAAGALAKMLKRHTNIELHIVGPMVLPPSLSEFGNRVKHLPLAGWQEWLAVLNTFEVNLAPLESGNPFCHAKSEIKYTEAALLSIPTIASRTGAFEFAIRDGETGFLADDADEWAAKLEQLLADPALRRRVGESARADVLARYAPAVLGQELVQTLDSVQQLYAQQQVPTLATAPDPRTTPLILNWIFPEPIPGSGGYTDIIRMMNLLASFGHQINAYVVPKKWGKSDLEMRDFIHRHFADPDWCLFKWNDGPMVESDAVILTHWTTAYMINDTNHAAKVFYFVQDWEPFFAPMSTNYLRAEQTYKMGFSCITLGSWLTEFLRSRYNADADYFDLAVDHEIYYPRPVAERDRPQVCFYARPSTPRRLFPMGVETLQLIYQHRPDVEIVLYGADDDDLHSYRIPFPYTNRGILKEHELAELFSASDVGVVLSSTNCSLIPLEMMACKCAVVDLDRPTVRGVLEHEVNALLAEPVPQAIANAVLRLLDDEPLRQRLIKTAYQQVQQLSWVKSARRVEEILYDKLPPSRRVWNPRRFDVQPGLLTLADLPPEQRGYLDAAHNQRRRVGAQLSARIKKWGKRLLQVDRGWVLGDAPVQMLGLYGRRCIGQSFVARRDNLHRVDVLVATYRRPNTRDVILHLRESPTASSDLATVQINASLIIDNSYARFTFEPQPGSRGKSYYFSVESPESATGDAIALWAYRQVDLPDARLYWNGRPRNGQLVFGLFYLDDRVGEVGERPFSHGLGWRTALWPQLKKAYQLLSSRDLPGLWQEVVNYWKWKSGKA
ncbi:MAG: glycosyltransferase [Chloroflexota bacterium]|nr:glycosyltransferase [Chloroflexota bacterium]